VEFPAEGAELFDESFLDEVVDIFGVGAGFFRAKRNRSCAFFNFVERGERLFDFRGGKDADGFEGLAQARSTAIS